MTGNLLTDGKVNYNEFNILKELQIIFLAILTSKSTSSGSFYYWVEGYTRYSKGMSEGYYNYIFANCLSVHMKTQISETKIARAIKLGVIMCYNCAQMKFVLESVTPFTLMQDS